MFPGISGRLITASFALTELPAIAGTREIPVTVVRDVERWSAHRDTSFGPASSLRAITDGVAIPLLTILGYTIRRRFDGDDHARLETSWRGITATPPTIVVGWDQSLDATWRTSVLGAVRADARWCFCSNGTHLRIVDAHRTWSRQHLDFDLALLAHDPGALELLWRLGSAESMAVERPLLDRAVDLSSQHGAAVCRALADGVRQALELLLRALSRGRRQNVPPAVLLEQSLTLLYRVLFLLFAEARGLVPVWHPVYRDRYTIDSIVTTLLAGRRYRGVWMAINAISRLAHAGCTAGALKVTAFNGRLFSPTGTGAFDRERIADDVMAQAVMAVSTTAPGRGEGRHRIAYRDLDVEELGAVYEHVLEFEPAAHEGEVPLSRSGDLRKATGTFYTPRSLTSYLVREALGPLVADRSADEILALRVLDPAMGSGAFLVAACAYLADAAEAALVRDGHWHRSDVTAADRVMLRRSVAQRCLFGVDLNPTAVQVARLSLWLTTLAADKPLTFLDHRLIAGNSLVGANPDDMRRQPGGGRSSGRRPPSPSLFDASDFIPVLRQAVHARLQIERQEDDSAAVVRGKEKALASLQSAQGPVAPLARALDLWCAGWFWPTGSQPDRATFAELADLLLHRHSALPTRVAASLLAVADAAAARHRFLHWPVAFPEVFTNERGEPRANPGFDAIIGNPPWDMVRGDSGDSTTRLCRRDDARSLAAFARGSGIYRIDIRSHVNRYQLFVERALQLARAGGRIAFVLPGGAMTDGGSAPLRVHLFDRARIDTVVGFDNRHAIFPIHRSVRFVLVTCTTGVTTNQVRCRFRFTRPEQLDDPAAAGRQETFTMTRAFLSRLSGADDLAIPEIENHADLRILEQISARFPALRSPDGWNVAFGRELNATDDRGSFVPFAEDAGTRCVLEGKQIDPFRTSRQGCRYQLAENARVKVPRRPRLAYRDVASATNRLTLIAAIVPADAVTTHTLCCLKTPVPIDAQHVLCALLNSFVANYLVRFRVNTHVTVALVARLPAPTLHPRGPTFERLSSLARTLMHSPTPADQQPEYAELQGIVARLYGLCEEDYAHVLSTFPLIPAAVRTECLRHCTRHR
jgi:methylase of polypeptide subunit release factors